MTKVALLIGVSEYEPSWRPLPAALNDIEAMRRVLQHPEMGDFDEVQQLPNCDSQRMGEEIETLFEDRQKEDLVLLYFSGHGIKDESGRLYFATRNTRKNEQGRLVQARAVAASFVHDIMSRSRSRHQVIILDCCFSGAFAEGLRARDDGSVDVGNQLGGEGRAILTSSTSTQYAFEQKEAGLSIYTRYLVEGIETGAADSNDNGVIAVYELHEYARKKVREAAPTMKPEIYPVKEGYRIQIAKSPVGDPKLRYRKEAERLSSRGEFSPVARATLDVHRDRLGISPEEADTIENEVLQPYREYKQKLERYEQTFNAAIQRERLLSKYTRNELQGLQQVLGLRNKDVIPIRDRLKLQLIKATVVVIAIIGPVAAIFITPNLINPSLHELISSGEDNLLQEDQEDNEALIYVNNKKADATKDDPLKIGVSVPIDGNPYVAREILRGVAYAQKQLNDQGGIKVGIDGTRSRLLKVEIADDKNDETTVKKIASKFVDDKKILAVVGHNSSEASLAAAPEYQKGQLAMITPTSDAKAISEYGSPVFHTMPRVDDVVSELVKYAKTNAVNKIAVCFDSKAPASEVIKDKFTETFKAGLTRTKCDLSENSFNSSISTILDQAIKDQSKGILLVPGVRHTTDNAIQMASAARKKGLALLAPSTINSSIIIEEKKGQYVEGMVVAVPWNPTIGPGKSFVDKVTKSLGQDKKVDWRTGALTWRTAMAYDTTLAIAEGISTWDSKHGKSDRERLIKRLSSRDFEINNGTATGKVSFQCERQTTPTLLKVQKNNDSAMGYEFAHLSLEPRP